MGLQVRILLYAADENAAFDAASVAFSEIARLDAVMSDYRPDSELMQLVSRAGSGPVPLSPDLFHVLDKALSYARQTDGLFDVTVSPLARVWRTAIRTGQIPSKAQIDSARALVDWRSVLLDSEKQTAELAIPGMQLDLGAIGKGYAADKALEALRAAGISSALIEFGGDVRAGAPPPGEAGWRITVASADSAHRHMVIHDAAIASSGDTEQYTVIDGLRYSHVVNPRTGYGLSSRASATVVAACGIDADALATVFTLLDAESGLKLLREQYPDVRAYVRIVRESVETVYSTF